MTVSNTIFNKQLERAMARNAAKKAPELKVEPATTKLSKEELQVYIDILLAAAATPPMTKLEKLMYDSADLTHKILTEKYGVNPA
ncbi:hypothetical protein [Pseudomonas sp. Irchel s3h17]|uniref:hypothetical protein n=1 Tax=Pseudomonas sp. Irchel s3h17 TaxID=2009182 RepID=UPI000BA3971A|nr:hypothetical protein [Pseudomonas sp. Irchel s3h17]